MTKTSGSEVSEGSGRDEEFILSLMRLNQKEVEEGMNESLVIRPFQVNPIG
jgi:hypothetical protein